MTRFRSGSSGGSSSIGTKVGAWVKKTKAELKSLGHSDTPQTFFRIYEDEGSASRCDTQQPITTKYRYGVSAGYDAIATLRYEAAQARAAHTSQTTMQTQTDCSSNQFVAQGSSITMESNESERTTTNFAEQLAQKAGKFYKRGSANKSRKTLSDSERQLEFLKEYQAQQDQLPKPDFPQCWSCGGVLWGVLPHLRENPAAAQLCGGCSPFVTPSEEEILRPEVDENGQEESYQQMEKRLSRFGFFPAEEPEEEDSYSNIYEDVIVEEEEEEYDYPDNYNGESSRTMIGDCDETVIAGLDKTITIASVPRSD